MPFVVNGPPFPGVGTIIGEAMHFLRPVKPALPPSPAKNEPGAELNVHSQGAAAAHGPARVRGPFEAMNVWGVQSLEPTPFV